MSESFCLRKGYAMTVSCSLRKGYAMTVSFSLRHDVCQIWKRTEALYTGGYGWEQSANVEEGTDCYSKNEKHARKCDILFGLAQKGVQNKVYSVSSFTYNASSTSCPCLILLHPRTRQTPPPPHPRLSVGVSLGLLANTRMELV